jgi:type II secretory pathway pseudopilin PulG
MKLRKMNQKGQTLIALMVFVMVSILIAVTATTITMINLQANTAYANGETALRHAESGMENAVRKLLRDSSYNGETMTLDGGTVTITVSGTDMKTITSAAVYANHKKTITASAAYVNDALQISNWREEY